MIANLPSPPLPADAEWSPRRRVLQVAFACHPDRSMECRNGWKRAVHAAREHDVTLLYGDKTEQAELRDRAEAEGVAEHLQCLRVAAGPIGRRCLRSATAYYAGLRLWHHKAFGVAKQLHAERPFDLVHQTTFCGYREPGFGWKLGVPFVWGPIGGTHNFPLRYLPELTTPRAMWIELCRNLINSAQLRYSRRVRGAANHATLLLAATEAARDDFDRYLGAEAKVRLETAIDAAQIADAPRPTRDPREPLNILWAGRLRPWKALPLLLRALAKSPPSFEYRLRIMGVGPCEASWKRLAAKLGIADRVEWVGWPRYVDTWPHYRWADAFAFTSLRDTSGTGLLESLASGTPIVAVDHQGAGSIVNQGCGLLAPVGSPRETIDAFSQHLQLLARDERLWKRLSDGARAEAWRHTWEPQADALLDWYAAAWRTAPSAARSTPAAPRYTTRQAHAEYAPTATHAGSPV